MNYNITNKTDQEVEVRVIVPVEQLHEAARKAAAELSKNLKINGFRPGKASYEVIKQHIGEMKILQESAGSLVASHLNEIIAKERYDIFTQPQVDFEKLAPGNEFIFKAKFFLFPEVIPPDFSKIKIEKREKKVETAEIDKSLEQLRAMRVKEVLEIRPAKNGDKVEIDFETSVGGKLIEGGKAGKQSIVIGEGKMIPGFENNLIGLGANQEKEFELEFPKDYVPELAGKKAKFKVKIHGVHKRELPKLDDEFAKSLGQKDLADLRNRLKENLVKEKQIKERERQELDMIDKVTGASGFSFVPEEAVQETQKRMVKEIRTGIENQGGKFDDYLKHIKKSEEDLRKGFENEARKRVKTQLLFRKIILDNKISVMDIEVDQQIGEALDMYASMPEMAEKIKSESYRVYTKEIMLNRRVIKWLRERVGI